MSHPRERPVIDPGRQPEQRVPDDDPGMVKRDMGELRAAGRIANGKGPAVRRPQPCIDGDPRFTGGDPGGGKIECG